MWTSKSLLLSKAAASKNLHGKLQGSLLQGYPWCLTNEYFISPKKAVKENRKPAVIGVLPSCLLPELNNKCRNSVIVLCFVWHIRKSPWIAVKLFDRHYRQYQESNQTTKEGKKAGKSISFNPVNAPIPSSWFRWCCNLVPCRD